MQPDPFSKRVRIFGVGTAGVNLVGRLMDASLAGAAFAAVNSNAPSLESSRATDKVLLESRALRGLGTGGDPERGRALAEERAEQFQRLCSGTDVVFIVCGLGGGTGTGAGPLLARLAREAGALALGFAVLPFDCEGSRRQRLAFEGLEEFKAAADGVITLPNQKVLRLTQEDTSVLETFKLSNDLLADGLRGIWRLLLRPGLIPLNFPEVCEVLRANRGESVFAAGEASGENRVEALWERIADHPLLDGGGALETSAAVLVSLVGGPELAMTEVNRFMEQVNARAGGAQVLMGAAIDPEYAGRLGATIIAAQAAPAHPHAPPVRRPNPQSAPESLEGQLLPRSTPARPESRFIPPAPSLSQEAMREMLDRQSPLPGRARKAAQRLRQGTLPLEIVSKGRFDKSEPTIHKGEDLDVPTYIRRGVALN